MSLSRNIDGCSTPQPLSDDWQRHSGLYLNQKKKVGESTKRRVVFRTTGLDLVGYPPFVPASVPGRELHTEPSNQRLAH